MCFVLVYCCLGMLMTSCFWGAKPNLGRKRITLPEPKIVFLRHPLLSLASEIPMMHNCDYILYFKPERGVYYWKRGIKYTNYPMSYNRPPSQRSHIQLRQSIWCSHFKKIQGFYSTLKINDFLCFRFFLLYDTLFCIILENIYPARVIMFYTWHADVHCTIATCGVAMGKSTLCVDNWFPCVVDSQSFP